MPLQYNTFKNSGNVPFLLCNTISRSKNYDPYNKGLKTVYFLYTIFKPY